jgi:NTE family protein
MPTKSIGLALSGGGVRAAAFHAGVLRYLAEQGLLESVKHVSSVSGGSLFAGLVFHYGRQRWPSSQAYLDDVLPQVRNTLTQHSLQLAAILRLTLNPLNWRFALARANVLAQAIHDVWGIDVPLGSLVDSTLWSIQCTTGETGRRFRFKRATMGDYELGYADVGDFPLAKAMAVSAAFPGGIGPLTVRMSDFHWLKRHKSTDTTQNRAESPFHRIHLYDGGIYDNLGIEPLFDVGSQSVKTDEMLCEQINCVVVSDAGAALKRAAIPSQLNPLRFKRLADIALDQSRALRVRAFVNFLKKNAVAGSYLQIGALPRESITRLQEGREVVAKQLLAADWLSADQVRQAATFGTTLRRLASETFDLLERHGHETAKWNVELFGPV